MLKFPKGSVILRENGSDSAAYLIVSGSVEVYREEAGMRIGIAHLGPGQIFGEMALVLERPRTASVQALEETVVEKVDQERFAKLLAEDPRKIIPFIRLIFERIRATGAQHLHSAGVVIRRSDGGVERGVPSWTRSAGKRVPGLRGKSPLARESLAGSGDPLLITSFPFRLGRKTGTLFADLTDINDLLLIDSSPYQVSRNHCSINKLPNEGGYFVQDRGSTLGTIVNGKRIGVGAPSHEAPLDRDRNELVLGLPESPFRFEVTLEPLGQGE